MRVRLATVFWWLGAVVLGCALLGGFGKALQGEPGSFGHFFGFVPLVLVLWALSFVLGGSFWKPPKQK